MRFLVDAQLPGRLCDWLIDRGHEAVYVPIVMPGMAADAEIARYATQHQLILVSKDEDFVSRHRPGPYRLVWLRIGNASNRALFAWLEPRFPQILDALRAGEAVIEVR